MFVCCKRLPLRHYSTVCVLAIGIAGLYEVGKIVAHLTCEVEMCALIRSPALICGIKEEPQIAGMEIAGIIPTGNGRCKLIIVERFIISVCLLSAEALYNRVLNHIFTVNDEFVLRISAHHRNMRASVIRKLVK